MFKASSPADTAPGHRRHESRSNNKASKSIRRGACREFQRSSQDALYPELASLLPRPFRRGEGWGEGLLGVVCTWVLSVFKRLRTVAFVSLWLGTAAWSLAQYSMVDLGDLGGGFGRARAINGFGQVAGEALLPVAGTVDRAVLWQAAGSVTDLGALGGQQSAALAINNAGTVCGWAQNASGITLAALWNGSSVTALPTLGGAAGAAWGINDAGTAVGNSYLSNGVYHAALWSAGGVRDLGTLGGTYSVAYDINNQGTAVGTASDSSGRDRAALWGSAGPVDLGGLSGGQWTAAPAINDSGELILWGTRRARRRTGRDSGMAILRAP